MFGKTMTEIKIRWDYEITRRKTFHSPRWTFSQESFGGAVPQIGDILHLDLPVKPDHPFPKLGDETDWNNSFPFQVIKRAWFPSICTVQLEVSLANANRFWNLPEENLSRLKAEWNVIEE